VDSAISTDNIRTIPKSAPFTGIQQAAADVVAEMLESGEQLPKAIADRTYSGRFMVLVPAETHRRLVIEAAEQHVSLNQLTMSRDPDREAVLTGACATPAGRSRSGPTLG
jgi:predicted HicB family RNase H-like nuclease